MQRLVKIGLLAGIVAAGAWFFNHFDVRGLDKISVKPRPGASAPNSADPNAPPQVALASGTDQAGRPSLSDPNRTLKIASYNIQVFGASKLAKPDAMRVIVDVIQRFDLVAIQEVRAKSDDILPRLLAMLNAGGRHYDFIIGPRLGRTSSKEQYAIVYDRDTVECDRGTVYTVEDRDDLLHREPLVAWFRARGPAPQEAFTFTLVDIHTDPDEVPTEVNALAGAYRAVRNDGHNEDDVIVLGDLNADNRHLGELGKLPNIMCAITGTASNTRRDKLYDNMIFNRTATVEYTGRAGVLDVRQEYNLSLEQALEISDHFPIWAEFSIFEGRQPGRVAEAAGTKVK